MSHRSWFYTLNNYTPQELKLHNDLHCTYHVFGREKASIEHLQGNITFKHPKRLPALKKLSPRAHWKHTISLDDARNYCMKELDYKIVDNRKQGERTDLTQVRMLAIEGKFATISEEYPGLWLRYSRGIRAMHLVRNVDLSQRNFEPEIHWLYGPSGSGKTRYVYDKYEHSDIWASNGTLKWWDGYENQKVILIDEFRSHFCSFDQLLRILDRYPYRVQVKGGFRNLNSKVMYITSCYSPEQVYATQEDVGQLLRRITTIRRFTPMSGGSLRGSPPHV